MRRLYILGAALSVALVGCSKTQPDAASASESSAVQSASAATADNAPPSGMPASNPAAADATNGAPLTDQAFVQQAALGDMFEIASSKLALQQSHNDAVRAFAHMMIVDHTRTTAGLKAAVAKSGETLSLPQALPADKQATLQDLKAASGANFDRKYMDAQVAGHKAALDLMSLYANDGSNAALKGAAQKTGRLVQTHLDKATQLRQSLG